MSRSTKQAQNDHFEPLRHVLLISTDHIINYEYNWNQRNKKTYIKLRKYIEFQYTKTNNSKTKGMLGQNELQNPTFVILKDQTSNLEPKTIFPLTKNNPLLLPFLAFI